MKDKSMAGTRNVVLDDHTYTGIPSDWSVDVIRQKISEDGREPPADLEDRIYDVVDEEDEESSFTAGGISYDPLEEDPSSWADYAPLAGELITGLATGAKGFAKGAEIGTRLTAPFPHPAAKVGGAVVGGALGMGAVAFPASGIGNFGGEIVESLVEGTSFNPDAAAKQAWDAAQTGAIWTSVLGTAFPAGLAGGKMLKEWFKGRPVADEAVETMAKLQEKLKAMGSTLYPTMVNQHSRGARLAADVANVSEVTKQTVRGYFKSYSEYMGGQTEALVRMFPDGGSRMHGENVQKLLATTEKALYEIVKPIYTKIDIMGKGININAREGAAEIVKKLKRDFRGEPVRNADGDLVASYNWNLPGGAEAHSLVKMLDNLPSNMTFSEAHQHLSTAKTALRDIKRSANPNTNQVDAYNSFITLLHDTMDATASKLAPALKKDYEDVSAFYRQGKEVITDTYLAKAMDVMDPSQIGKMLTQDGFSVGLDQIRNLKKLAAQYQSKLAKDSKLLGEMNKIPDVLEGIRRGYIESSFKVDGQGGIESLKNFRNKLTDPDFKQTFTALFSDTAVPSKIEGLLDELIILERAEGSAAGYSLTVAQAELGAAKEVLDPSVSMAGRIIRGLMPGFLAKRGIQPEAIDRQIQMIRAATEAAKRGTPLPPKYWEVLAKISGNPTSALVGRRVAAGAQGITPREDYN